MAVTYTLATMDVPPEVYDLIEQKLRAAGYEDRIGHDGVIDMTHIGLISDKEEKEWTI